MLVREKFPLLKLDYHKWNYTQIYTEKMDQITDYSKKRKIRQFAQQILKEGLVESQFTLLSNPD